MINKRLSLILMITNRILCIFKSIVQKQVKIHILIGAANQTKNFFTIIKKDIWMKLKEKLILEAAKDTTRYFQDFTLKEKKTVKLKCI